GSEMCIRDSVETVLNGRRAPIILETQDIQARQYVLRNKGGFFIPPYTTYDDMLKVELDWMRRADLCAHLNEEEHVDFQRLLPEARHALIYPAVAEVPRARGREIIVVASDNYGNYESVKWLLETVAPLAPVARVSIYGNIDGGVKRRARALYEKHRDLFKGRVDDIGAVYANAGCVLLPTVEGHGLSIKAVEALSCGAPLVATPLAFRGMGVDPRQLRNVALAEDAAQFAALWRDAEAVCERGPAANAATSDTRRLYEETFSPRAYSRSLAAYVTTLVES
ncbi:MAG: glycosyltransferase family 4 protein, partial [Methylocystis sp.]|nr:glycosyltransferase family 4 protein [Methylocystis sp.]